MDPVTPLVLLGGVTAAFVAGWVRQARENRRAILGRILGRVDGQLEGGLAGDTVVGRHGGRDFRLRLSSSKRFRPFKLGSTGSTFADIHPIVVELALHHPPPVRIRVRRDAGLASVEKALGLANDVVVAGGGAFDRRLVVEVQLPDGSQLAETPLADRDVRTAIEELLGKWRLDEVRVEAGRLVARGAPELLGATQLQGLLTALDLLAHAFDRRPALELNLGLDDQFVWAGGVDATARCPFCKDGLGAPAELVSCERCRTLLHGECHQENGGCPIFGCGERGAAQATKSRPDDGRLELA